MAGRSGTVLGHLQQLLAARGADDQPDGQLLDRFVTRQEESAFTALVQRHGPLVLRVCRRLLGNTADADDAFQATFLVLVRKARTLDKRGSLAGWLYGVAYRIAVRARAQAARRRTFERQAAQMQTRKAVREPPDPALRELLDEELSRLPEKYRTPIVLCYLEGKSYAEAARQLRWPLGTVRGRVARARILLRKRLTRRGLAVPIGLFGTVWASDVALAKVPTVLMQATVRASLLAAAGKMSAAGAFSAQATALGEALLKEMVVAKLKTVLAAVLALTVIGTGAGLLMQSFAQKEQPAQAEPGKEVPNIQATSSTLAPRLLAQVHQGRDVRTIALAPDGKTLAAGGNDGTLRVWDLPTARERLRLPHPKAVITVGFSAHGKVLASGTIADDQVHLWDAATGHRLDDHPAGHDRCVRRLAFAPKGDALAAAGYGPTIRLWETRTWRPRGSLRIPGNPDAVTCLTFSHDGTKLAAGSVEKTSHRMHLWDVATGRILQTFQGHKHMVNAVVFFPEGQRLASGSEDQTVRLWDVITGQEVRQWKDTAAIACLVLSRDGKTLMTGGGDSTIRLRDAATGRELHRLEGHPAAVVALALSANGTTLAAGSQDGTIRIWKLNPEK